MSPLMKDLMFTGHRAECEGSLVSGYRGSVFYPATGENTPIETEEHVNRHNIGVAAGVKALLSQLSEEGYRLVNAQGVAITPERVLDKPIDFGESFLRWHRIVEPNLRAVK